MNASTPERCICPRHGGGITRVTSTACPVHGEPVRVEEPAGEPTLAESAAASVEGWEDWKPDPKDYRVAQSANADVRGPLEDARRWLRGWTARENAERGTRRRIERFHRWADAIDAVLTRDGVALPVPVGDETEALRRALAEQENTSAAWRELYSQALARVAGLEARELGILAAFYAADAQACANLCDEVLDRRGALLGRVREAARLAALADSGEAGS